MSHKTVKWSARLRYATQGIKADSKSSEIVRSMSWDMWLNTADKQPLEPYQLGFVNQLRSRLDQNNPLHQEFELAWKEAYDNAS